MKAFLFALMVPTLSLAASFVPESFSSNFEESYVSALSGKEKKSFGKIDYQYPGHIRLEKTSPDASTFVANPEKSWYYVPPFVSKAKKAKTEKGQVTIQESNKLVITKFLDALRNGLEGNKLFSHKFDKNKIVFTFDSAIQKEMNLKQAILIADSDAKKIKSLKEFERLELVYTDGKKINTKFVDLKEGVKFAKSHFEFEIPSNTNVTQGK